MAQKTSVRRCPHCPKEYRSEEGYGIHRVRCSPETIEIGELSPVALSTFLSESERMAKFHDDKAAEFRSMKTKVAELHRDVAADGAEGR